MRAIHKRSDGAFLGAVTALLFLAVCAWGGAALYARLLPGPAPALPAAAAARERLEGIALRDETALQLPPDALLIPEDGERLPAGALLARLADGSERRTEDAALFYAACDGWEALPIPAPDALSVAAAEALLTAPRALPEDCRGRLVRASAWYYVALAPASLALPEDGRCRLRFAGFTDWVPARLLAVSEAEDGRHALLFRLNRGGSFLSLRRVQAEIGYY